MPVKIIKSYKCGFCGSKINQEYVTRILSKTRFQFEFGGYQ